MLYDVENVYDCLKQQLVHDKAQPSRGHTLPYDHNKEGMVWMQFIGLKDKNGKEIYEGDVLECKIYSRNFLIIGVVKYEYREFVCYDLKIDHEDVLNYQERHTTILGNIYENPELLKTQK